MIFKDYYKILGLEDNKVTESEIKAAYREQAKLYHPDVNDASEERFKDINEAYKILSNSSQKRKYDRSWYNYIGKKKKNSKNNEKPDSLFDMFFGNIEPKKEAKEKPQKKEKSKAPVKGENIETEINITLEEGFFGADKKIALRTVEGKMKNILIKVPAGIRNNEKIRLIGQGKAGLNGAKNGDLFIKIHIEEKENIRLQGNNIYTNLYLTPWEATLGTKTQINSIDDTSTVHIPKGIQSGEKVIVPGKGYKDALGGRGDLIAEVRVMVPKNLTTEEKELYQKLKEISNFNPRAIYN